tara:strand:+ start:561 stop:764 length:204 start_codon:yes stop_codon:yes gene_type:complete
MPKMIYNPPNWEQMFNASVRIVKTNIDEKHGQQLVVEMLEFGKRLYIDASKEAPKIPIDELINQLNK